MKYTVYEFRTNLRKALNEADSGHEVLVERYGQTYRLTSLVGSGKHDDPMEDSFDNYKVYEEVQETLDTVDKEAKELNQQTTCKAGHLLGRTGRCLQKGCKYA